MLVLDPHDTTNWFDGQYSVFPERMREALRRYVLDGQLPGDFLQAVICNNLLNACCRADHINLPMLKQYAQWFHNVAPAPCHGDYKTMMAWSAQGGINRTNEVA